MSQRTLTLIPSKRQKRGQGLGLVRAYQPGCQGATNRTLEPPSIWVHLRELGPDLATSQAAKLRTCEWLIGDA